MSGVDRLLDLVGTTGAATDNYAELDEKDLKASDLENGAMSPDIEQHMKLYQPVKDGLDTINDSVHQINQLKQKDRVAAKDAERHDILAELDKIMHSSTATGRKVKKVLDDIKLKDDKWAREHANQTAKVQIRRNMYALHTRQFHAVMTKYNTGAEEFKQALRDRTKRELSIVDQNLTDAQIDKIVDEGKAMDVVKQALNSDNLEEAIREIEQRHNDIQRLERSVLE
eukprot:g18929.t1